MEEGDLNQSADVIGKVFSIRANNQELFRISFETGVSLEF